MFWLTGTAQECNVEKPKRREDFQIRSKVSQNVFNVKMNIGSDNTMTFINMYETTYLYELYPTLRLWF